MRKAIMRKAIMRKAIMRKAMLTAFFGTCLAGMMQSAAVSEISSVDSVLRGFDSAVWRFQLAEILGTLTAIKQAGASKCSFKIDEPEAKELSLWLERPSAEVNDTSAYVTRRDEVERIMAALLKLNPSAVCDAVGQKLPASLKGVLHR